MKRNLGVRFIEVIAVAAALCLAGCGGSRHAQRVWLTIRRASPFLDSPAQISVRGLRPRERATLQGAFTNAGVRWRSRVPVRADASGDVRLRGVQAMRFEWGARPQDPLPPAAAVAPVPPRVASPVILSLSARGRVLARARFTREVMPPSVAVRKLTPRRDGVFGYLFSPAGGARRPGVLAFGGSEGGDTATRVAALLAAHGYPTLALAYFREPGLPQRLVDIPLEYFERALRILRRQPGVDRGRVVTYGVSYGGEASLLIASTFPALVHGAIALVPEANVTPSPSSFSLPAWTFHGKPVPQTAIPVERIDGPVLVAGGGQDAVWDSSTYTGAIEQRLNDARFRFSHQALNYLRAGHSIGGAIPYLPETPGDLARHGGSLAADEAGRADLWPRILGFLAGLPRRGAR